MSGVDLGGWPGGRWMRSRFLGTHELLQVRAEFFVGGAVSVAVEVDLEVGEHFVGGLVTLVAVAAESLLDNGFEARIDVAAERSEEHTSELQSLRHLVC